MTVQAINALNRADVLLIPTEKSRKRPFSPTRAATSAIAFPHQ